MDLRSNARMEILDSGRWDSRMEDANIPPVAGTIASLPQGARRAERLARKALRDRREGASGGRAWINGREVGGPDPRFAHLARSYD
jgi:hypothetical protein